MNKPFYQIARVLASNGHCSFCKLEMQKQKDSTIFVNADMARLIWFMSEHEKALNQSRFDFCTVREEKGTFYCCAYEVAAYEKVMYITHEAVATSAFQHFMEQYEKKNKIDFQCIEKLLQTAHAVDGVKISFEGVRTIEILYRIAGAIRPIDEVRYYSPRSRILADRCSA